MNVNMRKLAALTCNILFYKLERYYSENSSNKLVVDVLEDTYIIEDQQL